MSCWAWHFFGVEHMGVLVLGISDEEWVTACGRSAGTDLEACVKSIAPLPLYK